MALDTVIQVGANVNPALGPLKKVEDAMKRIQGSAFNLKLNARNFTEPLGRISGQVSEFEKSLDAANARVLAFGASAGVLFQFIRTLKETVRATVEVEKSLTDINVIFNKNEKQIKSFGRELFKIASQTGQSFNVVAEAATELARQGLSIIETQKRVKDALILTRLSGMSAKDSVESLTAALNTFKDVGLTSTQVINKLANVDAAFAVSTGDLAEALKRVGSTAQDVGVTFDQLNGLVASLQQTTARGGSVIGNALKTIFTRIGRPETLRQLEALGLTVRDNAKNTLPAINILKQLANVYGTLSDAQKSNITQTVAGVFQANILRATLKDLSKVNSEYARATLTSANATDEANKRNEKLNETLAAQTQRLLNNFKQVGAGIGGNIFGPSIQTIFGSLNKVLESGDSSNEFVQAGLSIGDALTKGIGKTLSGPGLALIGLFARNILKEFAAFSIEVVGQLKNMGTAAQTFNNVQQNISNILRSQPDIMMKIANGQTTIAREAAKVTQQLAAQRDLAIGINAASGPLAAAVIRQSGGVKKFNKSGSLATGVVGAAGGNPKMFSSLAGAINNEIRAGVPRSSIRINSSSSLAHSGNPMGLAVTNLKDEPMGLRSLGIPNFADQSRFVTTKGTAGGKMKLTSASLSELSEVLKKISQSGNFATDQLKSFEDEIRKNKGSLAAFRSEIAKAFKEYKSNRVENIGRISPSNLKNAPVASGLEMVLASQNAALLEEVTKGVQEKIREDLNNKQNRKGSFLSGERTRIRPKQQLLLPEFAESTRQKYFGRTLPNFLSRDISQFKSVRKSKERLASVNKRLSGATMPLMGLSLGMNTISQDLGDEGIQGQVKKAMGIGNYAITGALLGSMFPVLGPAIGAFAGGLLGLAKETDVLKKAFSGLSESTPQYMKDQKEITSSMLNLISREDVKTGKKTPSVQMIPNGMGGFTTVKTTEDEIQQKKYLTSVSKNIAAKEIFETFGGQNLKGEDLTTFARLAISAGSIGVGEDRFGNKIDNRKKIAKLAKFLPSGQKKTNIVTGFSDLGEELKLIFTPEIMSMVANMARDKIQPKAGDNIPLDFNFAQRSAGALSGARISSFNANTQREIALSLFNLQAGFDQRQMFGNELFSSQFLSGKKAIEMKESGAKASAQERMRVSELEAITSASKALSKGGFGTEGDIFNSLIYGGMSQIKEYSLTAEESNRKILQDLGENLIKIRESKNETEKQAEEEAKKDLEILRKTVELNRQSFATELQTKRSLDAKAANRIAEDAGMLFRRGSIGGAGLADANQAALSASIAANGLQRGDYGRGFNIAIRRNFQRNNYDVFQSTISAVDELSSSLKDGLKNALVDTILQARSASEAFSSLANALSRMALEKGLDMFFTAALSKIPFKGNNKGGRIGYASGGLVTGGSSANIDTVPAMLSSGEFVMRRAAVNRIGVGTLNAINSGGFSGLQSGGYANVNLNNSTNFLGNPRRPTGMSFNIDPSLSAFALTSSMNRQNQIRDEKAKQFMSYRRSQLSALAAFEKQKKGRRMGALIGAATSFGAAAIGGMGKDFGLSGAGANAGVPNGLGASADYINGPQLMMVNSGGSIPTMLTQGEFVINRQAASRLGGGMLGRMNSGSMSFNSGGATSSIPSQENGTDRVVEAIKELKATFEQKPQTKSQTSQSQQGNTPVNISVPISVNVTAATENVRSETENSNATEEQDSRQAMAKQLSENMRAVVLQEIEKQKRPGGTLYNL